jgi:hypothetical protein
LAAAAVNWPAAGNLGRSITIRPAVPHRIGRSGRIDHDHDICDWDYAAELFPPGALEPMPPPATLVWAHRLDASTPDYSPEFHLCVAVERFFQDRYLRELAAKERRKPRIRAYQARYRERRRRRNRPGWWR